MSIQNRVEAIGDFIWDKCTPYVVVFGLVLVVIGSLVGLIGFVSK